MPGIAAVVVTYNRNKLLQQCLLGLKAQTLQPDAIFVIDNASTDGTADWLRDHCQDIGEAVQVIRLNRNTGGAGGFCEGLRLACSKGYDWVWMMDDDAYPYPTALRELMKIADDPSDLYGSLAVSESSTSWATTLVDQGVIANEATQVPSKARVEFIPFLGILIHRFLVEEIGYPDVGYFIAGDDVEYSLRAKRAGAETWISGASRIEHPRAQLQTIHIFGARIAYLSLPAWKRYYDTRNRLINARRYHGVRLFTHALPGTALRFLVAMWKEPGKLQQSLAFLAGIIDGCRALTGERHGSWGIRAIPGKRPR